MSVIPNSETDKFVGDTLYFALSEDPRYHT